jgi:integrative and conjugative element protein (TIGR02256 family)
MEFFSSNGDFGVGLDETLLRSLLQLCAKSRRLETGGILVGFYSSDSKLAVVTHISNAPEDSRRGSFSFTRGVRGLQEWLLKLWQKPIRQYYLGEWHFHPASTATASEEDISQLHKIACSEKYHCPEPILLILGGSPKGVWQIKVYISVKGKEVLELLPRQNFSP